MRSLSVRVEAVTPMFLGGANPRGAPELRAASFRGVMRFWLRALLGAYLGDNLKVLRQAESAVFGSTDGASPVVVQVKGRPHYVDLERRPSRTSGYNYLYWSVFLQRKGRKLRCIAPGSTFQVLLSLRPGVRQEQALWRAGAALWLTVRLGGLGSRSRRTLGSLVAREEPAQGFDPPLPPFVSSASGPAALAAELEAGIRTLCSSVGDNGEKPCHGFNVLHKDRCSVWVVAGNQPWPTWEGAAEKMGAALRALRQGMPLRERAALGLPLKGAPKSLPPRYASPLILTIAPLRGGGFAGIVVLFEPLLKAPPSFKDSLVCPFVGQFDVKEEVSL